MRSFVPGWLTKKGFICIKCIEGAPPKADWVMRPSTECVARHDHHGKKSKPGSGRKKRAA